MVNTPSIFKEARLAWFYQVNLQKSVKIQLFISLRKKGTELKIETEVEYNRDWIEVYDDYLTTTLSRDLPTAMTIECNDARI
jgi:hypothetical protein